MIAQTRFVRLLAGGLIASLMLSATVCGEEPRTMRFYIGSYTGEKSQGIHTAVLDLETGKISTPELAVAIKNPSFLALHPQDPTLLYAVTEIPDAGGKPVGAVAALKRDVSTGRLTVLNAESSGGAGPCHLVVDATGRHVLVANYSGGSMSSLPIGADGRIGRATSVMQHRGRSVNPQRQQEPHAHSVNLDPANRFAFVADLGLDQVLVYRFDAATGELTPHEPPHAKVTPGAGPRHFAFRPDGHFAYVINEIGNTVTAFQYDGAKGTLRSIQEITTLPEGYSQTSYTAEVVAHPSGKFLYGSNRGHDSIAMFAIDAAQGRLTPLGQQSTKGKTPRNFAIDPTGRWLLAENQASDSIHVFRIDPQTGRLSETGHSIETPSPVCVRFARDR